VEKSQVHRRLLLALRDPCARPQKPLAATSALIWRNERRLPERINYLFKRGRDIPHRGHTLVKAIQRRN